MDSRPTKSRQLYRTGSKTGLVSRLRMSDDSWLSPLAALGSSQDVDSWQNGLRMALTAALHIRDVRFV